MLCVCYIAAAGRLLAAAVCSGLRVLGGCWIVADGCLLAAAVCGGGRVVLLL